MTPGLYLTALISFIIGLFGVGQVYFYSKIGNAFRSQRVTLFSAFWFSMGVVWIFVSIGEILGALDLRYAAFLSSYVWQTIIDLDMIIILMYFATSFFGKFASAVIFIYAVIVAVLFEVSLFKYGFVEKAAEFFSDQIVINDYAKYFFLALFIPMFLLMLADLARLIFTFFKRHHGIYLFKLMAAVSILMLGISGSLDQLGLIRDWVLTLTRIGTLLSAMIAFFAVSQLSTREDELAI